MRPTINLLVGRYWQSRNGRIYISSPGRYVMRAGQTVPLGDNRALDLFSFFGTICLLICYFDISVILPNRCYLNYRHYGIRTLSIM